MRKSIWLSLTALMLLASCARKSRFGDLGRSGNDGRLNLIRARVVDYHAEPLWTTCTDPAPLLDRRVEGDFTDMTSYLGVQDQANAKYSFDITPATSPGEYFITFMDRASGTILANTLKLKRTNRYGGFIGGATFASACNLVIVVTDKDLVHMDEVSNFPNNQGPYAVLFFDLDKLKPNSLTPTPKPYHAIGFGLTGSFDHFRVLTSPDCSLAIVSGQIDSTMSDKLNLCDIDPFGSPHSVSAIAAYAFWEFLDTSSLGATIKPGHGMLGIATSAYKDTAPKGGSIVTILNKGSDYFASGDLPAIQFGPRRTDGCRS